jgi:TPR repeat protein
MDEPLRLDLLTKTKQALDAEDWNGVERLWQPWVEQGDAEAAYQLAYHYLWCTPCDDDAIRDRMYDLLEQAAAKDHADAIWFLASRQADRTDPEFERTLLRAGQLGSVNAQRLLGVMYATGDWSGPKDLAEAVRWYRFAAEKGHAESQYDLGFMLLLGQGAPRNVEEGLNWLERAGELGEYKAFRLLLDCYENGYCDVPVDTAKTAFWRSRAEEYDRLHTANPCRRYSLEGSASEQSLRCLSDIDGVIGFAFITNASDFSVFYEPALITPAQLDAKIRTAGIAAIPEE